MIENAARVGPYLLGRLRETVGEHPYIGELRGVGLILAVEFMADRATGAGRSTRPRTSIASSRPRRWSTAS